MTQIKLELIKNTVGVAAMTMLLLLTLTLVVVAHGR
jgi:hypothetical protein